MRIVAAGVSGFIGGALVPALRTAGHDVVELVRREPDHEDQVRWNPGAGELDPSVLSGADAVINLCGAGVGDKRWTAAYRDLIRSSRVEPTALLARACAEQQVPVLINGSAVGIYGDREDEVLDESSTSGPGFLAEVCREWEAATATAEQAGTRVVHLRTGLVIGAGGGLFPKLATLSTFFLGGRLGNGRQYCPWISLDDEVAAILHLLEHEVSGPVNLTGPVPVRNKVLVSRIAAAVHRPAPWWVPGPVLSLVLGGFADEVLGGQRAVPSVLTESGFSFRHPTLDVALRAAVEQSRIDKSDLPTEPDGSHHAE